MEFYCVEAVGNHLIAVHAHAIDHLIRTMDNIEHKERLDLAEFRELLHDGVVIAMCNVLGELIPDKEDATLGKTIGINDFCQPISNVSRLEIRPNFMSRRTMAVVWMADSLPEETAARSSSTEE